MTNSVIIIGAGPAGLSAAIQLIRQGITPVVFEENKTGGLLRNANLVENYPGFPAGISGDKLADLMEKQARNAGVKIIFERVVSLRREHKYFSVFAGGKKYCATAVIAATGTLPRLLRMRGEAEVLYEVYPIKNIKGKRIVIIGAGDAAFDYALGLSRYNRVSILNRTDRIKCLPVLFERASKNGKIEYYPDTPVEAIVKRAGKFIICAENREIDADFVISATGRIARTELLSPAVLKSKFFYQAGDVQNGICRQAGIAVGDGIKTAMKAAEQLSKYYPQRATKK